jgi:DNA (cytosine-5)-methyltransferase 1
MKQVTNHIARQVGESVQARINALKVGQKMQDLPEELWHESFRFYVKEDPTRVGGPNLRIIRLDPARPSLTVTGYIFNKFVHPVENRYITPREAARLQGFPDEHEFVGTLTSVQLQVGNAVPVQLAQAATQAVLEHLVKHEPLGLSKTRYKNYAFPALSLFSGAGGLDLGLEQARSGKARFVSKCAVEFNDDCCKTLRHNFGERIHVVHADIREVNPEKLVHSLGLEGGVLPLVIGGPPCQAFSQAGKQEATNDPRGNLIFEFLRFVRTLKPVYFVMENVFGLRGVEEGRLMRDILKQMDGLGYNVNHQLLHAVDYGAAQLRRRFFFIGVQKPYPAVQMPLPTYGGDGGLFASKPFATVGEAFAGLPPLSMRNGSASYPVNGTEHAVLLDKPNPKAAKRKAKPVSYRKAKPKKKSHGQRKPKKAVANIGQRKKRTKPLN